MQANENFGQLRLIARISLWFGALALGALLLLIAIGGSTPSDYFQAIGSLSATRQQLPVLMTVGCLLLAIGTALTIWMIALYSSFRVAGPLHRFCIDLEDGIRTGQVPRIRIRQSDFIQEEARHMEASVSELYRHYDALGALLEAAEADIRRAHRLDAETIHRLRLARELAQRVRV